MKLCIFGSRGLKESLVTPIIQKVINDLQPDEIVTAAEPGGVCSYARSWAQASGITLTLFEKVKEHNQGQYHFRSVNCYNYSDQVLIIHDGKSKGSKNEFDLAIKMGIPIIYYSLTEKNNETPEVVYWDTEAVTGNQRELKKMVIQAPLKAKDKATLLTKITQVIKEL